MDKEVKIDYVNERKGNRPPSIKCDDGNYYTISDDAYQSMLPWKGNVGQISYTTNAKGFHQATHWNGAELPRGDVRRTPAATGIPHQPPPQQPQTFHPPADKPVPFGYVSTTQGRLRTMPSVKEQFIMKVVEATTGPDTRWDILGLIETINIAKTAWEDVMEAPKPAAPTMSVRDSQDNMTPPWEPPPPNSPDDYLAGG